jgi:hypothetical protein
MPSRMLSMALQRPMLAHDRNDEIRCVSVDSCDEMDGLLVVASRRFVEDLQA